MKHWITNAAMVAFMAASFAALAGGWDQAQRQIAQRLQEQKLQLAAAEKAQGAERDKMMQAHMKMMGETMGRMQAMKPREGMTLQEQKEWIEEHQKLMEQMMGQMMTEHHLLMQKR